MLDSTSQKSENARLSIISFLVPSSERSYRFWIRWIRSISFPNGVCSNEWYAKDTSRKVKTALHAKFAAGQKLCTYAPLGYRKHTEQRNKLIVDEETRWIIEKIFDLAVHGAGAAKIAKTLVCDKVPTAGWLNYQRYGTFANIYAEAPVDKAYAWTISQVKSILRDETYIGGI